MCMDWLVLNWANGAVSITLQSRPMAVPCGEPVDKQQVFAIEVRGQFLLAPMLARTSGASFGLIKLGCERRCQPTQN